MNSTVFILTVQDLQICTKFDCKNNCVKIFTQSKLKIEISEIETFRKNFYFFLKKLKKYFQTQSFKESST